ASGGEGGAGINRTTASLTPLKNAPATAERLRTVPQVSQATTLLDFVPQEQEKKLALIKDLGRRLGQALQQPASTRPPTDAENIAALNSIADQLNKIAGNASGPGAAAAKRLAAASVKLAQANEATRARAQTAF